MLLVVAAYLLPTMAALGIVAEAGDWELGFYGKVAQQVGGGPGQGSVGWDISKRRLETGRVRFGGMGIGKL